MKHLRKVTWESAKHRGCLHSALLRLLLRRRSRKQDLTRPLADRMRTSGRSKKSNLLLFSFFFLLVGERVEGELQKMSLYWLVCLLTVAFNGDGDWTDFLFCLDDRCTGLCNAQRQQTHTFGLWTNLARKDSVGFIYTSDNCNRVCSQRACPACDFVLSLALMAFLPLKWGGAIVPGDARPQHHLAGLLGDTWASDLLWKQQKKRHATIINNQWMWVCVC